MCRFEISAQAIYSNIKLDHDLPDVSLRDLRPSVLYSDINIIQDQSISLSSWIHPPQARPINLWHHISPTQQGPLASGHSTYPSYQPTTFFSRTSLQHAHPVWALRAPTCVKICRIPSAIQTPRLQPTPPKPSNFLGLPTPSPADTSCPQQNQQPPFLRSAGLQHHG